MSDYGFKTNDDLKGPVADLIKLIRDCEKSGIDVKNAMNLLRRPDRKEVLKEINEFSINKTQAQRELEAKLAQQQRASDFGIGE